MSPLSFDKGLACDMVRIQVRVLGVGDTVRPMLPGLTMLQVAVR